MAWTMGSQGEGWSWASPCGARIFVGRHVCPLQEPGAVLSILHVPAHEALTFPGNQEGEALAVVPAPGIDPSVDTADGVLRRRDHMAPGGMVYCQGCQIALKYSDLLQAVTACPVCSEQLPVQLPKKYGAIHRSSPQAKVWQTDDPGHLPLNDGSKYVLTRVDTASSLTEDLPSPRNQVASMRMKEAD